MTAMKSEILNRENLASPGSTIVIRYRTYAGASPVITVYGPTNAAKIAGAGMREVQAGLYEYSLRFTAGWALGDYSVVCSEPTYGTSDAIVITLRSSDIESVSSDVSAILGSVTPIRDVKSKVDAFSAAFSVIEENIARASEALAGVSAGSREVSEAAGQMTSLYANLKEMSAKIKELGSGVGGDLAKLYEVTEAKSQDINYIRNKTQELKALMLVNQQMMENTAKEEPVIQTWYEYR